MAKQSLLKNTDSIGNIQDSINAFGKSLRAANNTSSVIIRKLNESNRSKKGAIGKERMLYQKRRSAVRMREKEDVIEASRVSGIFRRTSKVIGDSTKGFLGRIMDFLGTILVGWVVTNLPVIIDTVEDLIKRIQKTAGVLTGWFEGTRNFFTGFTSELGNVVSRITGVDLEGDKKQAEKAKDDVLAGSRQVENDFQRMEEMIRSFDLLKSLKGMLGLDTEDPKNQTQGSQGSQGQQGYSVPDDQSFRESVSVVAKRLGVSEDDLYAVMAFETGGTFNPAEKNKAGSGATGLIQFMPETAEGLGTTTDELAKMSRTEQMKYVEKFLSNKGISGKGLSDLYMAVLFPAAVGKPDNFVLFGKGAIEGYTGKAYEQNKGLDANNDGSVTKAEASAKVMQYKGVRPESAPSSKIEPGASYNKGQDITSILGAGSTVTSLRGNRSDPISGRSSYHNGIDIGCAAGLYIALRVDAEIDGYGVDDGYGQVIDLWVPSLGVQLRFAHNSRVLIKGAGSKVPAGTSFAITGSTGRSTAPHIHFEADTTKGRTAYKTPTSINPSPYVNLIMLTKANIEGRPTSIPNSRSGKGGPQIEGNTTRGSIASNVTPEGKPSTIEVPIPMGGGGAQPQSQTKGSQGGGQSMNTKPDVGNQLNSFISKVLLTELANV